jgi:hypothetical protein
MSSNKINARLIKKTGYSVRDHLLFEAQHISEITPELAMEAQDALGFMPAGYGFEDFKVRRDPVLLVYKATWRCQASCD